MTCRDYCSFQESDVPFVDATRDHYVVYNVKFIFILGSGWLHYLFCIGTYYLASPITDTTPPTGCHLGHFWREKTSSTKNTPTGLSTAKMYQRSPSKLTMINHLALFPI